ncbi:MAG TPA: 4'-phosphopantetheinyl transferase superfamily protein [Spongiibacteraceae bacterium]
MPCHLVATYCQVQFNAECFSSAEYARNSIVSPEHLRGAVNKRRAEFLAGRICARAALNAIGYPDAIPAVNFDRSPCWPAGVVGAITHDNYTAAAVVAHAKDCIGIGLDSESVAAIAQADDIVAEVLTPIEADMYWQLPQSTRAEYLTLAFSLKESLFKALYPVVGRYFDFQSARLCHWDTAQGCAQIELCTTLSQQWCAGSRFSGLFARSGERLTTMLAVRR